VRSGAEREIADLRAQIEAARARKEAPARDPQAEVRAKQDELAQVEEAALGEFAQLQAVLLAARRHVAVELKALVRLSGGGPTEERIEALLRTRLLDGESIADVAADLEEQWTRLAF
jgi:hypothetical protein